MEYNIFIMDIEKSTYCYMLLLQKVCHNTDAVE